MSMIKDSILKEIEEENKYLKENLINLVKDHKKNCHSDNCGVSLHYIRKIGEKAGLKFTDDELRHFM